MTTDDIYINKATGKEFRAVCIGKSFSDERKATSELYFLEPIDDNLMPEIRLGDLLGISGTNGYYHYVTEICDASRIRNEFGNLVDIKNQNELYRDGIKIWERKP